MPYQKKLQRMKYECSGRCKMDSEPFDVEKHRVGVLKMLRLGLLLIEGTKFLAYSSHYLV